jgi:integrase
MVERFILQRAKVSPFTANKEIRYLRSTFNFAKKRKLVDENPVDGIDFLPMEKKVKYVPPSEDIDKIIAVADPDTQDYLWVIRDTMARVNEVNWLTWDDVSLEGRFVILYTRKKKGGHRSPRKVPMTDKLFEVLSRRYSQRDPSKPWVFWHEYISSKTGEKCVGPYQDRKKFMKTLCRKAGVKYFRFHALRRSGASVMDSNNVPIGAIQRILGHENRTTTEIYLHSIGDSERVAISVYEQARKKSHTDSHTNEKGATSEN